jgi:hypothetical protein
MGMGEQEHPPRDEPRRPNRPGLGRGSRPRSLAEAEIDADEQAAASLMALAVRLTKATGFYRGPGGNSVSIITFGPVTLTAADGSTSTFNINID